MRILFLIILTSLSFSLCHGQVQKDITTIILVRHAEKLDDGTKDPDLSLEGKKRASKLTSMLMHSGVDAIYSTPYKRTLNTVIPLSKVLGIEVQEYDPSAKDFIESIYEASKGKTILVSGHSNTTPMAVSVLLKTKEYENIDHEEYGRIFIVSIAENTKTNLLEIQY